MQNARNGDLFRLKTEPPGRLKGGTKLRLDWISLDPNLKITVFLVVDGNSGPLFRDQPPIGGADIVVPRIEGKDCQFVLTSGERKWTSKSFEIVSHAPNIDGVDIELPRK